MTMRTAKGEQIRKQHLYRRLILTGKARLSRQAAVRMIGPDCAYHLYRRHAGEPEPASPREERARAQPGDQAGPDASGP
jgi:hypothetical protein